MAIVIAILFLLVPNSIVAKSTAISNELIQAVDARNKAKVISLLKNGRNPNTRGFLNITPLMRATYLGDIEIVNTLIKAGADVNASDIAGTSALHIAAKRGHSDIINFLIQRGAVRFTDSEGYTPLMRAILYKRHDAAVALINTGSRVDFTAPNGLTILEMAYENNDLPLVKLIESRLEDFRKLKEKALENKRNAIMQRQSSKEQMQIAEVEEEIIEESGEIQKKLAKRRKSGSKPKFQKLPWLSKAQSMRVKDAILEYDSKIKNNTKQVMVKEIRKESAENDKYIRMNNEDNIKQEPIKEKEKVTPPKAKTKKKIKVGEAIPIMDEAELQNFKVEPTQAQPQSNIPETLQEEENIISVVVNSPKEASEIVSVIKGSKQYSHLKLKTMIKKVEGKKEVHIRINNFLDWGESFAVCEILTDEYNLDCNIS